MKLILSAMAVLAVISVAPVTAIAKTDSDWNWSGKPNCKHPRRDSAKWMKEGDRKFIRFQLRDGDIGGCPTDNDRKHSKKYNKPYSERAEWTGHVFKNTGKTYHISFDIRLVSGFDQDRISDTFFQIKDCPSSKVPLQARLGGWKKPQSGRAKFAFSMGTESNNSQYFSKFVNTDPVDNRWHRVDAYYKTGRTKNHSLEIRWDGEVLLPRTEFANVFDCNRARLHIGIYRAGDENGNSHSIVDYDKIQIKVMK